MVSSSTARVERRPLARGAIAVTAGLDRRRRRRRVPGHATTRLDRTPAPLTSRSAGVRAAASAPRPDPPAAAAATAPVAAVDPESTPWPEREACRRRSRANAPPCPPQHRPAALPTLRRAELGPRGVGIGAPQPDPRGGAPLGPMGPARPPPAARRLRRWPPRQIRRSKVGGAARAAARRGRRRGGGGGDPDARPGGVRSRRLSRGRSPRPRGDRRGGRARRPPAGGRCLLSTGAFPRCAARVPGRARPRSRQRVDQAPPRSGRAGRAPLARAGIVKTRVRRTTNQRRHDTQVPTCNASAATPRSPRPSPSLARARGGLRGQRSDRRRRARRQRPADGGAGAGTGTGGRRAARTGGADVHLALRQHLPRLLLRPEPALPQPGHEQRRELLERASRASIRRCSSSSRATPSPRTSTTSSAPASCRRSTRRSRPTCRRRWPPGSTPAR